MSGRSGSAGWLVIRRLLAGSPDEGHSKRGIPSRNRGGEGRGHATGSRPRAKPGGRGKITHISGTSSRSPRASSAGTRDLTTVSDALQPHARQSPAIKMKWLGKKGRTRLYRARPRLHMPHYPSRPDAATQEIKMTRPLLSYREPNSTGPETPRFSGPRAFQPSRRGTRSRAHQDHHRQ